MTTARPFGIRIQPFDTVIIGAGVLGLWLAKKLSETGVRVALIECSTTFATGATTRNEGWCHSGAYHAAAIENLDDALAVARQTRYGSDAMKAFAPEAILDPLEPSVALFRDEGFAEEAMSRWELADVAGREVSKTKLGTIDPALDTRAVSRAFEVEDRAVNTTYLCSKLARHAHFFGGTILRGTQVDAVSAKDRIVRVALRDGSLRLLQATVFVCSAGGGSEEFFRTHLGLDLPFRFFKSHLIDVPRRSTCLRRGYFFVDRRETTVMHHGDWSVMGLTAEATRIATPEDREPETETIELLKEAFRRLVPGAKLDRARPRACVKVDCAERPAADAGPQLSVSYREVVPGFYFALPGKMTEASFVADRLAEEIYRRVRGADRTFVSRRTIDRADAERAAGGLRRAARRAARNGDSRTPGPGPWLRSELRRRRSRRPARPPTTVMFWRLRATRPEPRQLGERARWRRKGLS